MSEIVIGPATAEDRGEVLRLLRGQFAEHGIPFDDEDAGRALHDALARPARGTVLIAKEGESAVGFAFLASAWSFEHGGPYVWLEEMYVTPDRRGAGIGGRLLDATIESARAGGARAVDLEVDESHRRAERLYDRRGFRRVRRSRWTLAIGPGDAKGGEGGNRRA